MNEAKPIVTCHGNQQLFSSLHNTVSQGLPKEACEWRRSFGRPPRLVNLDASFVPYDADILPDDEEKTLVSRPYFHIYWTDCDLDSYKQTVKDDIAEWHAALKARNIPDWLIVVVIGDESKMKTKLLLRASVIDKVKSDFCGKYPERCIVLSEPNKLDSKSSESWMQLFQRLRSLLLQAFNRHLNKYEESMRSRREKRTEAGWNYFSYFIFQEELAFMLEMLGLKEDALIQYDELDAMFDQFVENFASGDTVQWLTHLMEPCTSWAGVSLAKSLDLDLRDEVKHNNASLLAFRNYLFSRQAALLFQMERPWEVAKRARVYLHNTVLEMKALEVEIPQGALSCWVFLCCLEVLNACEIHNAGQLDDRFALHTANLWDFAHKKLRELGQLCSLMPGLVPTSEQLSLVVDLVSGMGIVEETLTPADKKPVDKLRESLSSPESFKRHYLEMCEQAIGTYKYIGRFRSSRMIGLELADFYMKINEPQKAENYLLDAIRMYQQEAWHYLADGTMVKLAECQKLLGEPDKYLKTCCHIACSRHISSNERKVYFEETKKTLDAFKGQRIEMRASQVFFIEELDVSPSSGSLKEELKLSVGIYSNFPQPVTFESIQVSICRCTPREVNEWEQLKQEQKEHPSQKRHTHKRQPSATHISLDKMANFQPVTKQLPDSIQFRDVIEKKQGKLVACGITCENAKELLKRTDSASSSGILTNVSRGDYSMCFSLSDVTLQPGLNALSFMTQISSEGVYRLGQMCLGVKSLDLLKPLNAFNSFFSVASVPAEYQLIPKHSDVFIGGIEQEAVLKFSSGSYILKESSQLSFTTAPYFSITSLDSEKDLTLEPCESHQTVELPVKVFMNLKKDVDQMQESKVNLSIDKLEQTLENTVQFLHPFQASHKIYTAGAKKYLQILVECGSKASFTLQEPTITSLDCRDVTFHLMNRPDQTLPVNEHQSCSLLWVLESNVPVMPALDLAFTCTYQCDLDCNPQPRQFGYSCTIQDFQTQYILSYSVSSIEEDKSCTAGETAILDINIKQLIDLELTEGVKLAYRVKADGAVWAIGGKTTGVFTMKEGKHHIVLDVVPMQAGLLYFPLVSIFKYQDTIEDSDADGDSDSDSSPLQLSSDSKSRTDSTTSVSSALFTSHLVEFSTGQVYNESRSKQIHVYPCKTSGNIEVTFVQ